MSKYAKDPLKIYQGKWVDASSYGHGNDYGYGTGYGYGDGYGYGCGYGDGEGYGSGDGYGSGRSNVEDNGLTDIPQPGG